MSDVLNNELPDIGVTHTKVNPIVRIQSDDGSVLTYTLLNQGHIQQVYIVTKRPELLFLPSFCYNFFVNTTTYILLSLLE